MSRPSVVSNAPAASLDLAMIGNCAISALVDSTAHVVWCCMPRFDSTPVFDALMQSANGVPDRGAMSIELEGFVRSEQSYDHGTAILRTRMWDALLPPKITSAQKITSARSHYGKPKTKHDERTTPESAGGEGLSPISFRQSQFRG